MDISGEISGEDPQLLSCHGLLGHRELLQVGSAAGSSSCAACNRTVGMVCKRQVEERRKRADRLCGTLAGCELTGGAFLTAFDKVSLWLQAMQRL